MDRWRGKTAVVTGASAGIGAAITLSLAQHGLKVLGLARREHLIDRSQPDSVLRAEPRSQLESEPEWNRSEIGKGIKNRMGNGTESGTKNGTDMKEFHLESMGPDPREFAKKVTGDGCIISRQCDVSDPAAVADTFRWAEDNMGPVHVLVNNAGVLLHGHMTDAGSKPLTDDEIRSVLDVNINGLVLCSRHAVASMKRNNVDGHIVNINSIAGHYIPNFTVMNVYPGTKHAVTAITQGLANEMVQFNLKIKTTSISPGLVATEMADITRMPELRQIADSLPRLEPEDVADTVVYALSTPPQVNICELTVMALGERRM